MYFSKFIDLAAGGFLLIFMVFFFTSCETENSADVNQDRIFTAYRLQYDADEDITVASARFRFGGHTGTLLELTDPSTISVNGENPGYNSALAYYSKNFSGLLSEAEFLWTDTEGISYQNTITLRTIAFPETDTIARDASYEFFWQGEPLDSNEYVTLRITDVSGEQTGVFTNNTPGSTSVILSKNDLQELLPGEARAELIRGISADAPESPAAGGLLSGLYSPEDIEIILN